MVILIAAGAMSLLEGRVPASAQLPVSRTQARSAESERADPVPQLTWKKHSPAGTDATVEIVGADPVVLAALDTPAMTLDLWTSFLTVRVVPERPDSVTLWGSYGVANGVITYRPRFPLERGIRYQARFDPVRLDEVARKVGAPGALSDRQVPVAKTMVAEYSLPTKAFQPTTTVLEVYPTSPVLPENLLRIYIHFSAPMSRGEVYRHVALFDATSNRRVDTPFLELDEELCSNDGMRFTLLFDPGRIKRGLRPREEAGPILESGKSYTLVIDRDWRDAQGTPLASEFRKSFRAGPPDDVSPDPRLWKVRTPGARHARPPGGSLSGASGPRARSSA